ncbi:MAG: peptidase M3 [Bdellovibrionales bacterium GWA2_49_15]|nr:MAG: peptidase M3 [Bdellovibrionales bacterium GWA2_49_15]HAZ13982.1 peptidase M3 [Bdellovibrionales bacterium]
MNYLLEKFDTKLETVPFSKIKNEHFLPAIKEEITAAKAKIESIKSNTQPPTFQNVCEVLDIVDHKLNIVSNIFFNLHSADTNDERQKLAKEISPIITEYGNDVSLDQMLFQKVKAVFDKRASLNLNAQQNTLLEKQYKGFVRNGALLSNEKKEEMRALDKRLSDLSLNFSEHTLEERKLFELWIEDEKDLSGLPDSVRDMARAQAKEKGRQNAWYFNLDFPSYMPFMTYADNRQLREKLFFAQGSLCAKDNKYDNRPIVLETVKLRHQRAQLLGFASHAHYILAERMAESPEKVENFLNELHIKARPFAEKEMAELKQYAKAHGLSDLCRWDVAYYAEKLKKERFNVDDEMLRPYFKLENVIAGAFQVAEKLYGLDFLEDSEIETYNPEVRVYRVLDRKQKTLGVFYADFFPRAGKRSGAWMTEFRSQSKSTGKDLCPHVAIVCNFTKSTADRPSLLGLDEVLTLFHEFGHALHGLLSDVYYESLAGTSVYWDFVELPSQIMENWVYEKECLDLFAKHFETGERIPEDLISRIKRSMNFHEGRMTVRQLGMSLLDMAWHNRQAPHYSDVAEFENKFLAPLELLPPVKGTSISSAFSHIFSGGYSAGYYSYKWAEVLDADAFMYFKEKGIFSSEVATKFKDAILSRGGSEHPMILYKNFRGQEPSIDALLKRAGLN